MNAIAAVAYRVRVSHAAAPYKGMHAFEVVAGDSAVFHNAYRATSPHFGLGPAMPTREAAIIAVVRAHGGLVESIEGSDVPSFA